jgi:predicted tellurium resistance membrane protein TerC
MSKLHVVTSISEAPDKERRRRMFIYTLSMLTRFACVALVVFTTGIWQWVFIIGAVFLPYFAVVVANNVGGEIKETDQAKRIEPLAIDIGAEIRGKHE